VPVCARDIGRTVGAKFMLTRSAEAFAMMCPTLLLRLLKKVNDATMKLLSSSSSSAA